MKIEDSLKRRNEVFIKRNTIRVKKAQDYATEDDTLQNFKDMANLISTLKPDLTTPEGNVIYMITHKLLRTCRVLFNRKGKATNESIEDTVAIDGPNYWDLLDEVLLEKGLYKGEI